MEYLSLINIKKIIQNSIFSNRVMFPRIIYKDYNKITPIIINKFRSNNMIIFNHLVKNVL